jgi:hypothetical protein
MVLTGKHGGERERDGAANLCGVGGTRCRALKKGDGRGVCVAIGERKHGRALEKLPDRFKALPMKWVYKIKRDAKGNNECYKARLVAKRYLQSREWTS